MGIIVDDDFEGPHYEYVDDDLEDHDEGGWMV